MDYIHARPNENRYKLIIEYDGTGFCGWQRQINGLSVQQVIEDAIQKFSGQQVRIYAAGRTDAGVHAFGQVAHFDLLDRNYPTIEIIRAINHFVRPHKVGIIDCKQVTNEFHARFSAVARHYLYRITTRSAPVILEENRVWWVKAPLDIEQMRLAAAHLIGNHDFTSFRAKECQSNSPIKTLSKINIMKEAEEIRFYLSAPSFLHHMVRNIIGTLKLVGISKLKPDDINSILAAKDRAKAGPTAPAYGLYFIGVDYK